MGLLLKLGDGRPLADDVRSVWSWGRHLFASPAIPFCFVQIPAFARK